MDLIEMDLIHMNVIENGLPFLDMIDLDFIEVVSM